MRDATAAINKTVEQQILALLSRESLGCRTQSELMQATPHHPHELAPALDRLVRAGLIRHLGGNYNSSGAVFQLSSMADSVLMGRDPEYPAPGSLRSVAHIIGDPRGLNSSTDRNEHRLEAEHPSARPAVGVVRASCKCGWKGPWRTVFEMQEDDATAHRIVMEANSKSRGEGGVKGASHWISTANGNHVQDERWQREQNRKIARETERLQRENKMQAQIGAYRNAHRHEHIHHEESTKSFGSRLRSLVKF